MQATRIQKPENSPEVVNRQAGIQKIETMESWAKHARQSGRERVKLNPYVYTEGEMREWDASEEKGGEHTGEDNETDERLEGLTGSEMTRE